jgi:hypothetical protein
MDVDDNQLISGLTARDGPLPERTRLHWSTGACRYAETVGERPCPWCAAEERRTARERQEAQAPERL